MGLTREQEKLLAAIHLGSQLKVHRSIDGEKIYQLHTSDNSVSQPVSDAVVRLLERQGYVKSNMKFPAATFMLTEKGTQTAVQYTGRTVNTTGPRNFDA